MLVAPLVLLAALVLAFAYAPRDAPPRLAGVVHRAVGAPLASRPKARSATSTASTTSPASPGGLIAGTPDLDQSTSRVGRPPSGEDIQRAARATRAFLGAYLRYSYRRLAAARIPDATAALRAALADQPPATGPGQHAAHPRLVSLGGSGGDAARVAFLATVTDGRQTYTVALTLARSASGGWLVSQVW